MIGKFTQRIINDSKIKIDSESVPLTLKIVKKNKIDKDTTALNLIRNKLDRKPS